MPRPFKFTVKKITPGNDPGSNLYSQCFPPAEEHTVTLGLVAWGERSGGWFECKNRARRSRSGQGMAFSFPGKVQREHPEYNRALLGACAFPGVRDGAAGLGCSSRPPPPSLCFPQKRNLPGNAAGTAARIHHMKRSWFVFLGFFCRAQLKQKNNTKSNQSPHLN